MRDPYALLGLDPSASQAEIKRAFRLRAKALHPDANPDDPVAEAAFRDLTEAYATLSDSALKAIVDEGLPPDAEPDWAAVAEEETRKSFDWNNEELERAILADEDPEPLRVADPDFPYKERWEAEAEVIGESLSSAPPSWPEEPWTQMEAAGLDPKLQDQPAKAEVRADGPDLFDELYAGVGRRRAQSGPGKEALDQRYTVTIPFLLAAKGGQQRLLLPEDKDVILSIPAGIEEGGLILAQGMGAPDPEGGPPGDAILQIKTAPHPLFERADADLLLAVPISLDEAVLGGAVNVPTLDGVVRVKLPTNLGASAKMKLSGKGLPRQPGRPGGPRGDLILQLDLVLPETPDERLKAFLETWHPSDAPRAESGFDHLVEKIGGSEASPIEVAPGET